MPWDYAKTAYENQAAKDEPWHLERLINFGLGREKLSRLALKKHLPQLKIPDERRAFLELLIWNKKF